MCWNTANSYTQKRKKIANEQERITLGKIKFQCHHTIQLSVPLFLCNTYHR